MRYKCVDSYRLRIKRAFVIDFYHILISFRCHTAEENISIKNEVHTLSEVAV